MTDPHPDSGSATLFTLLASAILLTALVATALWAVISTAHHRLTAAADLTALSAAQSLATVNAPTVNPPTVNPPTTTAACDIATRIAVANKVDLTSCHLTSTSVSVEVSASLDLLLAHPTLTATARAGPV